MTRTFIAASLVLLSAVASAQEGGRQQYISDDISVTVREEARNDAPSVGSVSSGARVTVLESLGEQSFARIRTADGRVGWITARYLTDQPADKNRVKDLQTQLAESRERLKALQGELEAAQGQLEQARPAMELAADNQRLKAELEAAQQQYQTTKLRTEEERARRRTLVIGAGLIFGGIVLGLLLPYLGSLRRRRRNDF